MPSLSRRTLLAATGAAALGAAVADPAAAEPTEAESGRAATRPLSSPIVHRDRSVTFTLFAPSASTVEVLGGWGRWFDFDQRPLVPDGTGGWSITIGPLEPSFYFYWFIVNGVPTKDLANPSMVRSNPAMSTFLLPGPGTEFLSEHPVPHGSVRVLDYPSEVTGTWRQAAVWTPPGYSDGHRALPTFYLVHGGGGSHLDWIQLGRANVILDNLFAAGRLRPMVVVMPDGDVPGATAVPSEDTFPAELLDNLVPAVERRYRVVRSAAGRALAGLSPGGLQTWNVLLNRRTRFAPAGHAWETWRDNLADFAPRLFRE